MKKLFIITMALLLCGGLLGACETKEPVKEDPKTEDKQPEKTEKSFKVTYQGIDITPGTEFKKDSIDEKPGYTELPSCAFDDVDKVYTYAGVEITASMLNGKETIYSVLFISEDVKTPEGISLGDEADLLYEKYGEPDDTFGFECSYLAGKIILSIMVENDVITSIEYIYNLD